MRTDVYLRRGPPAIPRAMAAPGTPRQRPPRFRAGLDRAPLLRRAAARFAWAESSRAEADERRSRFSAPSAATLRRRDGARGFRFSWPTSYARSAEWRVRSVA